MNLILRLIYILFISVIFVNLVFLKEFLCEKNRVGIAFLCRPMCLAENCVIKCADEVL